MCLPRCHLIQRASFSRKYYSAGTSAAAHAHSLLQTSAYMRFVPLALEGCRCCPMVILPKISIWDPPVGKKMFEYTYGDTYQTLDLAICLCLYSINLSVNWFICRPYNYNQIYVAPNSYISYHAGADPGGGQGGLAPPPPPHKKIAPPNSQAQIQGGKRARGPCPPPPPIFCMSRVVRLSAV